DQLEAFLIKAEKARSVLREDGLVVDLNAVDTWTPPNHRVAAGPYLNDYGITVSDLVPEDSSVVIVNNSVLYGGIAAQPTTSQNLLTQTESNNVPASFTL